MGKSNSAYTPEEMGIITQRAIAGLREIPIADELNKLASNLRRGQRRTPGGVRKQLLQQCLIPPNPHRPKPQERVIYRVSKDRMPDARKGDNLYQAAVRKSLAVS